MALYSLFALLTTLLCAVSAQSDSTATYTNPILDTGADPWVIRYGGYYYLTYSTNDNITISRSRDLTDWSNAEVELAFQPPEGQNYSTDL